MKIVDTRAGSSTQGLMVEDYNPPNINTGITMDSLQKADTIKIPNIETPPSQADGVIAGANTELANRMAQLTPPETDADKQQQSLLDQMASLTGEMGQKAADQLTAEQSAKIPELKTQYADINAKILAKTAEYNAAKVNLEGQPIPTHYIRGQQAQLANQQAAEIGLYQAQAQGLSGQIGIAQDTANRAVDLKYQTISDQLNTYQAQLAALEPVLTRQEKKRAEEQQLILEQKKQDLEDKKSEDKNIQGVMVDAIQEGITNTSILDKISKAKSYEEALKIMAANIPQIYAPVSGGRVSSGGAVSAGGGVAPTGDELTRISKLSPRAQAVYNNPSLINNYTATEKGKITDEILNAGLDLQTTGKTSETEKLTAGYVGRMNAANSIITAFESNNPKSGVGGFFQSLLPDWTASNLLKTGDFQSMQQAERDFINAVLRKESGAAISSSEFSNAEKQYFPQPGDSIQVIAQKKANRLQTIQGMTNAAGTAIKNSNKSNSTEDPLGLR